MRISVVTVALAFLVLPGLAAFASTSGLSPTATCDSIIVPAGSFSWRPGRVVLGVVAVPPAYIAQTVASGDSRWPYWSKTGLVVRADSPPVFVSVPRRWRTRAAIGWGNVDAVSAFQIASCPPSSSLGRWNPYAGGFYLRARATCVPLTFRVGARTTTVRFGVGRRCS
jgi:hypothetical protein